MSACSSVHSYDVDPSSEKVLTRAEVGALLAKWQARRKPLHENHVTRLMRTGVRGVVLPSVLIGNRRVSSVEACRWWIAAVTAVDADSRGVRVGAVAPLTPSQRATLERHGIATKPQPAQRSSGLRRQRRVEAAR